MTLAYHATWADAQPIRLADPRERNARMNRFAREPEAKQIGSPYRLGEYCRARLAGKTPEQAVTIARRRAH